MKFAFGFLINFTKLFMSEYTFSIFAFLASWTPKFGKKNLTQFQIQNSIKSDIVRIFFIKNCK